MLDGIGGIDYAMTHQFQYGIRIVTNSWGSSGDFDPADWLFTTWGAVGDVALTALGIYMALIVYTRFAGLRTFSKLSGFDFAMTVAIGSIVAGSIMFDGPSLLRAVAALTA